MEEAVSLTTQKGQLKSHPNVITHIIVIMEMFRNITPQPQHSRNITRPRP